MHRFLLATQNAEDAAMDEEEGHKYRWIAEHVEKRVRGDDRLEHDLGESSDWDMQDSNVRNVRIYGN